MKTILDNTENRFLPSVPAMCVDSRVYIRVDACVIGEQRRQEEKEVESALQRRKGKRGRSSREVERITGHSVVSMRLVSSSSLSNAYKASFFLFFRLFSRFGR